MRNPDYSIVIPVYFNAGSLASTEARIRAQVLDAYPNKNGEIVFVDDGSQDSSYEELCDLRTKHPEDIRIIKLARNFGQVNAIWCGLQHTSGPTIIISADGQDPVELMTEMLDRYFHDGTEIVIGTREAREESAWRKKTSAMVYGAIKRLGNWDMPVGGFDYMLLGPRAKHALLRRWQPNTFFQVRVLNLGFPRAFIHYRRKARETGVSRWTFSKKMTYMIDGVLGHSYFPIRAISVCGMLFAVFSFLLALFFFIAYFFNPAVVRGWTPIVLMVLFIGGVQMFMIGVIGEYLWRVLVQVRADPPYIIEQINGDSES